MSCIKKKMVFVVPSKENKVGTTINFEPKILKALDNEAAKAGVSVSFFVNDICKQYLQQVIQNTHKG